MFKVDATILAASNRLIELLRFGQEPSSNYEGHWSHADYDEIQALAEILGDRLPDKFHSILQSNYSEHAKNQNTLASRLSRILELQEKFGYRDATTSDDAKHPKFQLPQDEKARVLELSEQIRKIVFASQIFDNPHKKRLLNRIAAIESEVHKEKGNFDVILGGVSDVGDTLKKFGSDLKPLTDRILEIKKITQRRSDEYSQIPAPEELPQLPAPEETD